jgi:hypothetical protein
MKSIQNFLENSVSYALLGGNSKAGSIRESFEET